MLQLINQLSGLAARDGTKGEAVEEEYVRRHLTASYLEEEKVKVYISVKSFYFFTFLLF